jgi:RNA polymerase sigma-70 factor (ECF subfamily)
MSEYASPVTMEDPRPDAELLSAHVAGDPTAFSTLVHRHRDRLWAVALRTLGNPDDAADALQDALLSAHRSAGSFRGDAQVTTWLHRIVVNACLDRLRRAKARPTVPIPEYDSAHPIEPSDPLGRRELAWEIDRALRTLPDDQRAALVLVDVEGYSVDETADLLGIPTGTVKSRCARGRAKLVPLLAHLRNRQPPEDVRSSGVHHDPHDEPPSDPRPHGAEP